MVRQPSSTETRDHQAHLSRHTSTAATTVAVQTARMLTTKRYAEMASVECKVVKGFVCQRGELKRTMNWFQVCSLRKRVQGDYESPCYPQKQSDACITDIIRTADGQRSAPETRQQGTTTHRKWLLGCGESRGRTGLE